MEWRHTRKLTARKKKKHSNLKVFKLIPKEIDKKHPKNKLK